MPRSRWTLRSGTMPDTLSITRCRSSISEEASPLRSTVSEIATFSRSTRDRALFSASTCVAMAVSASVRADCTPALMTVSLAARSCAASATASSRWVEAGSLDAVSSAFSNVA